MPVAGPPATHHTKVLQMPLGHPEAEASDPITMSSLVRRFMRRIFKALGYEVSVRRLARLGEDEDVWRIQAELLQHRARVVMDVGAHSGHVARRYAHLFPEALIYCFEPSPEPFARLLQTSSEVEALRPVQAAVSDRTGAATFHVNRGSYQGSLLPTSPSAGALIDSRAVETVAEIEVPTVALDDFCQEHGIYQIDVLKIDVQGGELLALAGLQDMLGRGRISLVLSEITFVPQYEGQPSLSELASVLAQFGFTLFGLYGLTRASSGILAYGDALFISTEVMRSITK